MHAHQCMTIAIKHEIMEMLNGLQDHHGLRKLWFLRDGMSNQSHK